MRELTAKRKVEGLAKRSSVATSSMGQEVVENQTRHGRLEKNKSLSMSVTKKYAVTHETTYLMTFKKSYTFTESLLTSGVLIILSVL